jgi:hypothetical protein
MYKFLKFILEMKLYMFRTVPLSIIMSYSLYTQQWCVIQFCRQLSSSRIHPDLAAARELSIKLYGIYHCCVYSE